MNESEKVKSDINIIGRGRYPTLYLLSSAQFTLLREDFETGVPSSGWTVIDNAGTGVIWKTNGE